MIKLKIHYLQLQMYKFKSQQNLKLATGAEPTIDIESLQYNCWLFCTSFYLSAVVHIGQYVKKHENI